MKQQANESKQKRQIIEPVVAFVRHLLSGEQLLVPKSLGIYCLDAAEPVSIQEISIALDVILPAYKVPKEVAEVHPAHLIILEIAQVLGHAWRQIAFDAVQHALQLTHHSYVLS